LARPTLSVLIPCLPYEIDFLYPRRRLRYHRELQQPNLFTSIDRTARLSAQECRWYIYRGPLPPLSFFLHPSYTFFSHTQNPKNHQHPQQSTTKHHLCRQYNNITTVMYVCISFQYKFLLFIVVVVASSIEVVVASSIEVIVARSQIKSTSTAVIKTTTQCTCITTPRAVALIIAKAIEIQFSDQKSR
jgi:hypothetical protein